jgi:cytochrome P450
MASNKTSLSDALRDVVKRKPFGQSEAVSENVLVVRDKPAARQGRKVVSGHFDPAVSKQLRLLALERDTNLQALLAEAINDLFTKYQKSPIA